VKHPGFAERHLDIGRDLTDNRTGPGQRYRRRQQPGSGLSHHGPFGGKIFLLNGPWCLLPGPLRAAPARIIRGGR
jgi:hypothetical protein